MGERPSLTIPLWAFVACSRVKFNFNFTFTFTFTFEYDNKSRVWNIATLLLVLIWDVYTIFTVSLMYILYLLSVWCIYYIYCQFDGYLNLVNKLMNGQINKQRNENITNHLSESGSD